jgi:hypothetical protein
MQGTIVALNGQQFTARVAAAGSVLNLRANLNIQSSSGQVTGTLAADRGG